MEEAFNNPQQYGIALGMLNMAEIPIRAKRFRSPSTESDKTSSSTAQQTIGNSATKKPRNKLRNVEPHFACPFSKHDPQRWNTFEACGGWHTGDLGTLFRHHLFGKHQNLNQRMQRTDPRRIDPKKFDDLLQWRESIKLKKKHGSELWTTAYMILFSIPGPDRQFVPSPYVSYEMVDSTVDEIYMHMQHRAIDDPGFVENDTSRMVGETKDVNQEGEVEKANIRKYYGRAIRVLQSLQASELRRVDENCARRREKLHQSYKDQLQAPQRLVGDEYLPFTGTAPTMSPPTDDFTDNQPTLDGQDIYLHPASPMMSMPQGPNRPQTQQWQMPQSMPQHVQGWQPQVASMASRVASDALLEGRKNSTGYGSPSMRHGYMGFGSMNYGQG